MSRESLESMPTMTSHETVETKEVAPESPSVVGIYISPSKGEAMQRQYAVWAEAGKGLVGDRYRVDLKKGTYSGRRLPEEARNITLISQQAIDEANAVQATQGNSPFEDSETRRNVVVAGVSAKQLAALIEGNQSIWLGLIEIKVTDEATPCVVPSKHSGKPGFNNAFIGRGGIRGTIVNTGQIYEGAKVSFLKS